MTDKNKIMNRKITILLGGLLMCASMGDNDTIQATVMADEQAQKWWTGRKYRQKQNLPHAGGGWEAP